MFRVLHTPWQGLKAHATPRTVLASFFKQAQPTVLIMPLHSCYAVHSEPSQWQHSAQRLSPPRTRVSQSPSIMEPNAYWLRCMGATASGARAACGGTDLYGPLSCPRRHNSGPATEALRDALKEQSSSLSHKLTMPDGSPYFNGHKVFDEDRRRLLLHSYLTSVKPEFCKKIEYPEDYTLTLLLPTAHLKESAAQKSTTPTAQSDAHPNGSPDDRTGPTAATPSAAVPVASSPFPAAAAPSSAVAGWVGCRNDKLMAVVRCNVNDLRAQGSAEPKIEAEVVKDGKFHVLTCELRDVSPDERDEVCKAFGQAIDRVARHGVKTMWACINDTFYTKKLCGPLRFVLEPLQEVLRPPINRSDFGELVLEDALIYQYAATEKVHYYMPVIGKRPFHKLFLVPGSSGSGKTMMSVTLPNNVCFVNGPDRERFGRGEFSIPFERIFGIFIRVGAPKGQGGSSEEATNLKENKKEGNSNASTSPKDKQQPEKKPVSSRELAARCAGRIYDMIANCGARFSSTESERALFYIVLDEMGSERELVKEVLAFDDAFDQLVRVALRERLEKRSDLGYGEEQCKALLQTVPRRKDNGAPASNADLNDKNVEIVYSGVRLELAFAVVGTGVGAASKEGGGCSLPPSYITVRSRTLTPSKVFQQKLRKIPLPNSETVNKREEIVKLVEADRLCSHLLWNARCAAYLGEAMADLALSSFGMSIDRWPEIMMTAAISVAREYFASNGWASIGLDSTQRYKLQCYLVSLTATQRHGYHLLSDGIQKDLRETVGAMEDLLQYVTPGKPTPATPSLPVGTALEKKPAKGDANNEKKTPAEALKGIRAHTLLPQTTPANGTKAVLYRPDLRFEVNPAMLLLALLDQVGDQYRGFQGKPSELYEELAAQYNRMRLDAFHYFFIEQREQAIDQDRKRVKEAVERGEQATATPMAAEWKLPASLLFPSLAGSPIVLTLRGIEPGEKLLRPEGPTSKNMLDRVDEIVQKVKDHGTVIELAGDGTPRNDIQFFSVNAMLGGECKEYYDGLVRIDTLMKRCFHMGFLEVELQFNGREALVDPNHVPQPSLIEHFKFCDFQHINRTGGLVDNALFKVSAKYSAIAQSSVLRHQMIEAKLRSNNNTQQASNNANTQQPSNNNTYTQQPSNNANTQQPSNNANNTEQASNNTNTQQPSNNANNTQQASNNTNNKQCCHQAMVLISPQPVLGANTEFTFKRYRRCSSPPEATDRKNELQQTKTMDTTETKDLQPLKAVEGWKVQDVESSATVTNELWSLDTFVSSCLRRPEESLTVAPKLPKNAPKLPPPGTGFTTVYNQCKPNNYYHEQRIVEEKDLDVKTSTDPQDVFLPSRH